MPVSKQYSLNRTRTLAFLDGLEAGGGFSKTFYMPPGLSLDKVSDCLAEAGSVHPDLYSLVVASKTGAALFLGDAKKYVMLPPFPIKETFSVKGCAVEPMRSILRQDWSIGLVLVRLGSYAVGMCRGERLVNSKVGTGLVHGRQRHGGSSAQRYGERRKNQAQAFLERVCTHARECIGLEPPDYLVYGGARMTIQLLEKECPFLRQFDDHLLPPLLDIPDPRQPVLEAAVNRVWSSRVIEWEETSL